MRQTRLQFCETYLKRISIFLGHNTRARTVPCTAVPGYAGDKLLNLNIRNADFRAFKGGYDLKPIKFRGLLVQNLYPEYDLLQGQDICLQ